MPAAICGAGWSATAPSAVCQFCDTDFVGTDGPGGGKFATADELADAVAENGPAAGEPYVVCTGGEPLLQLDDAAIAALHAKGFEIGIETNGTLMPPPGIDWICVSPKADAELVLTRGNELKLVYPQAAPSRSAMPASPSTNFFLQPMDSPQRDANTAAAIAIASHIRNGG